MRTGCVFEGVEPVTMAGKAHEGLRLPYADMAIGLQPRQPFAMAYEFFGLNQQLTSSDSVFEPAASCSLSGSKVIIDAGSDNWKTVRTNNCIRAHCRLKPR